MTKEELAKELDGGKYTREITKELEFEAKENGLVVVFGASDDLIEFRGAVYDERGRSESVLFDSNGMLQYRDQIEDDDELEIFFQRRRTAKSIEAVWCGEGDEGFTWTYKTDIPHSTFEIFDEEEKYCRGIVFSLDQLESASGEPTEHFFTCPNCGGHNLNEIQSGADATWKVIGATGEWFDYGDDPKVILNDEGEIEHYECADCSYELKLDGVTHVRDFAGFLIWKKEQCKEVSDKIKTISLNCKVRDECAFRALDERDAEMFEYVGYVPGFFPGKHFGDYLQFDIDVETGTIKNWCKPSQEQIESLRPK